MCSCVEPTSSPAKAVRSAGSTPSPGVGSVEPQSFVSHLRAQVERFGDTRALTYLREVDRELVEERVTFAQLDTDARAIAAWLATRPEADRPVLLLYVDGIDFLRAFLGCLYAGVIAVPAPLPTDERSLQRAAGHVRRRRHRARAHDGGRARRRSPRGSRQAGLADADRRAWRPTPAASADPDDLADARTSRPTRWRSCSTRRARAASPRASSSPTRTCCTTRPRSPRRSAVDDTTTGAGWLPHFHDMGLIGMLLQPLYAGPNLVFMSPMSFLKRPVRWLEMIDRYRAAGHGGAELRVRAGRPAGLRRRPRPPGPVVAAGRAATAPNRSAPTPSTR